MSDALEAVRWAKRVTLGSLRRLYHTYADGIIDEVLMDEVAFGFYARCESILAVRDAKRGRVKCPLCERVIVRDRTLKDDPIECGDCGWATTWHEYSRTFRRRQLNDGGAADVFEGYISRLPGVRTPDEKMRLIDWLVHECHKVRDPASGEKFPSRPVAPNLLRGTLTECLALLDELAYGQAGTPETRAAQQEWNDRVRAGKKQMRSVVNRNKAARAARRRAPQP